MLSSPTPAGEVTRPALCWITVTVWPASWCLAFDLLLTVLLLCIHLIGSCVRARVQMTTWMHMLLLASCGLSCLHQFALLWFVWSGFLEGSSHPSITAAYVLCLGSSEIK